MKVMSVVFLIMSSLAAMASEVNVKVSGMVCSMCAQGIQKKFKNESSVKSLNVSMDKKLVTFTLHEGKDLSDETITKLISEAGYNVAGIERK